VSKSKKIIFTVTNDLTYDQRMIRICTSLAKVGYEILLVGRTKENSIPLSQEAFQQKRLHCIFQNGKLFYLEYNIRLLFFLAFAKCEAMCAIDLDTIMPILFAGRLRRKVLIFDAHEYYIESPEIVNRKRVKRIWTWVDLWAVPKFKHCYTVGESLAEIFTERYKSKFEVIRNMPSRTEERDKVPSKVDHVKILLYQGVLNEGRGLEALIKTMHQVEGAELWLAGEGDLSKALRTLVKTENLEKSVKFLGYLQPAALKKLSSQAYIGFNLLENKGLNYYYSLANKFFDYVNAEVPSVNMQFPEYQKLNQQFRVSVLVENLQVENLAKAINQLLEKEELYLELKHNCTLAKEEWNWEQEEERLIKFYKSILKTLEISKIKQQIPKTKRLVLEFGVLSFGIFKGATCSQLELIST